MQLSATPTRPPRILDWGPSGAGKTARALTFGGRAQLIDIGEEGWTTGVTLKDQFTSLRQQVDVVQFKETRLPTHATAFEECKQYIYSLSGKIAKGDFPYDALIIDSLTELARFSINQIMSNSGELGKAVQIQHYGMAFTQTAMVLDVLKALPVVLYVIGHDQRDAIEKKSLDGKRILERREFIELAVTGKNMPAVITRGFEEVWYSRCAPIEGGKQKFYIQTKSDEFIQCKSRLQIPDRFDTTNVSMWDLLKQFGYSPPERKVLTPPATT